MQAATQRRFDPLIESAIEKKRQTDQPQPQNHAQPRPEQAVKQHREVFAGERGNDPCQGERYLNTGVVGAEGETGGKGQADEQGRPAAGRMLQREPEGQHGQKVEGQGVFFGQVAALKHGRNAPQRGQRSKQGWQKGK